MAVFCPYKADVVLYLECQECKNKSDCSTDNVFALLVAGSRTVTDKKMMYRHLDKLLSVAKDKYKYILIVEGGAKGADSIAGEYARDRGYLLKVMPADWDKNGKAAGFIRNKAMHELIARYEHRGCVLFWDGKSKGTAHNFGLAEKYKTTIRIIRTDKQEETK